jgi:hypothetical protein
MLDFGKWLLSVVTTTGMIGVAGYLLRDTFAKFLSKAVEHRFDKRLENFKGELRDNEKELESIRSFLVSVRSSHNSALQAKRLDAAESMLRARNALSKFSILVEYMKMLKIEEILKSSDPKISEFIDILVKPFDIDEKLKQLATLDHTLPNLYLSEQSLKAFSAYQSIILGSVYMMQFLRIPLRDKGSYINAGGLSKIVIELVPESKEGFEKWGDGYAYHWSKHFYDEILKSLRHEISGVDDLAKATETIEELAMNSRMAQLNVRSSLESSGLPKNLLSIDEAAAASSSVVQKTSVNSPP